MTNAKPFRLEDCPPWRDGKRRATICGILHVVLCDDSPGAFPIKVYRDANGSMSSWPSNAALTPAVEPPPPPKVVWFNRYPGIRATCHDSWDDAEHYAGAERIGPAIRAEIIGDAS